MPNRPTYGDLAFGSSGVPPNSTYRIAPANIRLQENMYGEGYSEFMDYGTIDAFPNPGYGVATGMPTGPVGRPGDKDANVDLMVQKMANVLENQFGLKPKMQGQVYTPPSQNVTTGWLCHICRNLWQISRNSMGKMILALWSI
jgi:hypothetical protein